MLWHERKIIMNIRDFVDVKKLEEILQNYGKLAVALSGGVDSSLVTAVIIAVFYFAFSGWHIGLPFGAAGIAASIILKSALITTLFGFAILKLKISPELDSVFCSAVSKIFGRKEEKHR